MLNFRPVLILIAFSALIIACTSGAQPEKKAVLDKTQPTPNTAPATTAPTNPPTTKPSHFSLDTSRQADQHISENTRTNKQETQPSSSSKPKAKPSGPPGYVTQKNVMLLAEPTPNAATVAPLNQYENVNILETIFTNEQGKATEYPTWYKVERESKQQGWVKGGLLNSGGGG